MDDQTSAERAHDRLIEGMVERTPNCRGIDAFTADHLTHTEITMLEGICVSCDLKLLCRAYVDIEQPPVGFWAGQYYGPKKRPAEAA